MTRLDDSAIRAALEEILRPRLSRLRMAFAELDPSVSLIDQGVVDSMAFTELLLGMESKLGITIDFNTLDVQDFVSIDAIVRTCLEATMP